MARIKVRGNYNGFIPATMMIYTASGLEYFSVSLASTSKLVINQGKLIGNMTAVNSNAERKPIVLPPLLEENEEVVLEDSPHENDELAHDKSIPAAPTFLMEEGATDNENTKRVRNIEAAGNLVSNEDIHEVEGYSQCFKKRCVARYSVNFGPNAK